MIECGGWAGSDIASALPLPLTAGPPPAAPQPSPAGAFHS